MAKMIWTALAIKVSKRDMRVLRLSAPYHLCRVYHLTKLMFSTMSKRQAKTDHQNSIQHEICSPILQVFAAVAAALIGNVSAFIGSSCNAF